MDLRPGDTVGYLSMAVPEFWPVLSRDRARMYFAKVPGIADGTVAYVLPFGVVIEGGQLVWGCCVRVPF